VTRKAPNPKIQVPNKRQSSNSEKLLLRNLQFKIGRFLCLEDVGFPGEPPSNTSKKLDKNVVVRVILHGQCSLQRKEAR
jgi:hypothetical protein